MAAPPPCAGCLDDRRCWVCLGTGVIDRDRTVDTSTSCYGSAVCAYCQPIKIDDVGRAPALRVRRIHPRRLFKFGTENA